MSSDLETWTYFIHRGETPDRRYWTSRDVLETIEKQLALLCAVLATPGASLIDALCVLPQSSFPRLWMVIDGEVYLSEIAKAKVQGETEIDLDEPARR